MSTSNDIRKKFISYFTNNNHKHLKSSPLIPKGDDTLLFTNAGMVQFKNIFMGLETAHSPKVVTIQKCLRAGGKHNDLDNVGYTPRHHTFFEMLGNFSFGDYFKEEAIKYAWEFLTIELCLPKSKLIVTVHNEDNEAFNLWKKISGLPESHILRIKGSDNFWEMADTGPCGPCSEIFYDLGENFQGGLPGTSTEGVRYLEVWNLVFMQYERLADESVLNLQQPCIDTGMGLERISAVLQGVGDNYETDTFKNIITAISETLKVNITPENKSSFKVIADHIRSSSFLIAEGVIPSNEGRGYVLRRIIRRAVRYLYLLGIKEPSFYQLVKPLTLEMGYFYKELNAEQSISDAIKQEENKFSTMFGNGLKILQDEVAINKSKVLSGTFAFKLYDTYGFPLDLTKDVLKLQKISVNEKEFDDAFIKHKSLAKESWKGSRDNTDGKFLVKLANHIVASKKLSNNILSSSAKLQAIILDETNEMPKTLVSLGEKEQICYLIFNNTPFYYEKGGQVADVGLITNNKDCMVKVIDVQLKSGGLIVHKCLLLQGNLEVDSDFTLEVDTEIRALSSANHTTAHLLHSALSLHVGSHVEQKGSFLNDKRLRFDFFHPKPLTKEEIHLVEESINKTILQDIPIHIEDMPLETALKKNAVALFGEKYPKTVTTVKIGNESDDILYSFELCGGTHAKSTGKIGAFKIISESSVASGVRRVEAITGLESSYYFEKLFNNAKSLSQSIHSDIFSIEEKVKIVLDNNTHIIKNYKSLQSKYYNVLLKNHIKIQNYIKNVCLQVEDLEVKDIKNIINNYDGNKDTVILLYLIIESKASFLFSIPKKYAKDITKDFNIEFLSILEASGGGKGGIIQGKGNPKKVSEAFEYAINYIGYLASKE